MIRPHLMQSNQRLEPGLKPII